MQFREHAFRLQYKEPDTYYIYHSRQIRDLDLSLFDGQSVDLAVPDVDNIEAFLIHFAKHRCEHCGAHHFKGKSRELVIYALDSDHTNTHYKNLVVVCPKCSFYLAQLIRPGITVEYDIAEAPPWARNRGLVSPD